MENNMEKRLKRGGERKQAWKEHIRKEQKRAEFWHSNCLTQDNLDVITVDSDRRSGGEKPPKRRLLWGYIYNREYEIVITSRTSHHPSCRTLHNTTRLVA